MTTRNDGDFYVDDFYFTPTYAFSQIVFKKTSTSTASDQACNPIDRFYIVSDLRVEGESSFSTTNKTVYTLSGASGGQAAGVAASAAQYSYIECDLGGYQSPNTSSAYFTPHNSYSVIISYYGDPNNAAQQGIYYLGVDGSQHSIAFINGATDGAWHTQTISFTPTSAFYELIIKKTVNDTSHGTNPVDYFDIERTN